MRIKSLKSILFVAILIFVLVLPYFVFAQNPAIDNLKEIGPAGGYAADTDELSISKLLSKLKIISKI